MPRSFPYWNIRGYFLDAAAMVEHGVRMEIMYPENFL